jgi:predicted membrane chloride channel (bestrophin family)
VLQAYAFRGHCGQIVNELKNPVPFPYYQALDVFILIDLVMVSYGLLSNNLDGAMPLVSCHGSHSVCSHTSPLQSCTLTLSHCGVCPTAYCTFVGALQVSIPIFVTYATTFIGVKEIGKAMSDPFDDDEIDFDLEAMLTATYDNALWLLTHEHQPLGADVSRLPKNPLRDPPSPKRALTMQLKGVAPLVRRASSDAPLVGEQKR